MKCGGIINNKSLSDYKILDIGTIGILCFVLEIFTTKFSGQLFISCPSFVVSLFAVVLAVTRWNLLGLLVIPFAVGGNWIGGMWSGYEMISMVYDWRFALSSAIGFLTVGVNVIFYKKFTTKKCMSIVYAIIGLIVLDYLLYTGVQLFSYNLLTSGNPFKFGEIIFEATHSQDVPTKINICKYVGNDIIYNLFGLGIAIIGMVLLRSQGAATNAVEKLVDDRKEIELNMLDQKFRIEENSEQPNESQDSDQAQN